jgi:hypothetical protein
MYNKFVTMELLYGAGEEEEKEKRMMKSQQFKIHYI